MSDPRNQSYPVPPYQGNPYGRQGQGVANDISRVSDLGSAQIENRYQTYVDEMGNRVESRQQIFEDQNQTRANIRYWTRAIAYFLLGVLEVILLLRLIFRLFGANEDSSFITFLYTLSHPFVTAFNGIFNDQTLGKYGVFEFSTLIAMVVYALIIWGLVSLVNVIFAPIQTSHQTITTTRRSSY
jgi:uncharacterized protein YggT (Ycf19 family)